MCHVIRLCTLVFVGLVHHLLLRQLAVYQIDTERPRDALCPLVISLNKIITYAEFFIIVT